MPTIHKSSGGALIGWFLVPPKPGEKIYIGYDIVSSQTDRRMGGWDVTADATGTIKFTRKP